MLALPDAFAKLRSRKDPPRLLHQNLKNIELTRRKRDFLSGPRNMAVFHIHVQVADFQQISGSRRSRSSPQSFDARHKLIQGKRLCEIIVRARFEAFYPITDPAERRKDENPRSGMSGAQPRQDR